MYGINIKEADILGGLLPLNPDLQFLTESLLDIIIIIDNNRVVRFVSSAYRRVLGHDPGLILGKSISNFSLLHPAEYDIAVDALEKVLSNADSGRIESRCCHAEGHYLWLEIMGNPIFDQNGQLLGAIFICRNITERKRIELALVESETRLKCQVSYLNTLINNMNELFYTFDREGRLTFANRKCVEVTGYTMEEARGKELLEFVPEANRASLAKGINHRLTTGISGTSEHIILTKAGEERTISANISPLEENGTVSGVIVVAEDITGRRRTEIALKEQLYFLQKLIDSIPNPIYYKDTLGLYQGCNKAFEAACGLTRDNIIGKPVYDVFPQDMNEYHHRMDISLYNQGGVQAYETSLRFADGLTHDVVLSRAAYTNMDGSLAGLVGVILDITDRKQLEKEVVVLERLNIMAEMAAGIAHEIRNPMTTARGFLQMLSHKQDLENYREYFDLIIEELDRANAIITEFLSLGKNKAVNPRMHSLNDIIKTLYPLLLADALNADKNVMIKLSEVPALLLDDMDIRQLILNLVRNGLEAMQPGGIMHILTYMDGGEVVLSVQDQGKGIEPGVLAKLGTPFLTTKDEGTGLGLAVCYSIAARHNATINVETGLTGTNFMVRFQSDAFLQVLA